MVKVKINYEKITKEQLLGIYNLYEKAYDIKKDDQNKHYFLDEGIHILNNGNTIDYHPFMGAKFFAEVLDDNTIEFWGYTRDLPQQKERGKFEKLLKKSFKIE